MILHFDEMEETIINRFQGGEKSTIAKIFQDECNKVMFGRLEPGASIGLHRHETSSEIVYVLQGTAKVLFDETQERLEPGLCHYCPKGHVHSVINDSDSDLIFVAVVPQQ
jgi:quercetin dioxygenase-like cupin family protein